MFETLLDPIVAFEAGLKGPIIPYVMGRAHPQKEVEVTFIAGLCNYHTDLKGNIIIIEKSIEVIRGFLQSKYVDEAVAKGVKVILPRSDDTYRELGWRHLFMSYEVIGSDPKLTEFIEGIHLVASSFRDYGLKAFCNLQSHLKTQKECISIRQARDSFKAIPAIICGAGASLAKDLESLKEIGERALIFGAGSSMGPLTEYGIHLHFGGAIDPNPPRERFLKQSQFELPLFYQHRVSEDLMHDHHGEKLWVGMAQSSPFEAWILKQFGIESFEIDTGWVVSNFLTHVAYYLGCDPIIVIGMDHCWTLDASYVNGVQNAPVAQEGPIQMRDRLGNIVYTRQDLLWAVRWFTSFAALDTSRTWINATEHGLAIEGWRHMSLQEVRATYLTHSYDLQGLIDSLPKERYALKSSDAVFEKIKNAFVEVRELSERWALCSADGGNPVLFDLELKEKIIYDRLLYPLWCIFRPLFERNGENFEPIFYREVADKFIAKL